MADSFGEDKIAIVLAILIGLSIFASLLHVVAGFVAGATRNLALVGLIVLGLKMAMELMK